MYLLVTFCFLQHTYNLEIFPCWNTQTSHLKRNMTPLCLPCVLNRACLVGLLGFYSFVFYY